MVASLGLLFLSNTWSVLHAPCPPWCLHCCGLGVPLSTRTRMKVVSVAAVRGHKKTYQITIRTKNKKWLWMTRKNYATQWETMENKSWAHVQGPRPVRLCAYIQANSQANRMTVNLMHITNVKTHEIHHDQEANQEAIQGNLLQFKGRNVGRKAIQGQFKRALCGTRFWWKSPGVLHDFHRVHGRSDISLL